MVGQISGTLGVRRLCNKYYSSTFALDEGLAAIGVKGKEDGQNVQAEEKLQRRGKEDGGWQVTGWNWQGGETDEGAGGERDGGMDREGGEGGTWRAGGARTAEGQEEPEEVVAGGVKRGRSGRSAGWGVSDESGERNRRNGRVGRDGRKAREGEGRGGNR